MRYMPEEEAWEPPSEVYDPVADTGNTTRGSAGLDISERIRAAWRRSKDGSQLVLPLWQTRVVCFSSYSLVLLALFGMSSFFQTHAESRLGVPAWVGGVVFSFAALTSLGATPLATALCNLTGRYCTLGMGLCVAAASTIGFGHAHSVAGLLVCRGVQGCGMALTAVSCMSLLLAHSPNVTADMGLQELFISLALAVAPALGGALYQLLTPMPHSHSKGYAWVFVWLCVPLLLPLVLLLLVPVLATRVGGHQQQQEDKDIDMEASLSKPMPHPQSRGLEGSKAPQWSHSHSPSPHDDGDGALAIPAYLPAPPGAALTPQPSHRDPQEPKEKRKRGGVLSVPGVLAATMAVTLTFSAQGFMALALAPHANASLGLSSFGAGLLFSCFNLPYALCGLGMGRLCSLLPPSRLMNLGLLLVAIGLAMLGPPPLWVHGLGLGGRWGEVLLWLGSVLGMGLLGTGQAWIVMPALDVMKGHCDRAKGKAKGKGHKHTEGQGQEEALAGLMNYAISAGAFLGPMLGGVALEYLPATPEARCQASSSSPNGSGNHSHKSLFLAPHALGCRNGYRWAVTLLSLAALALYLHSTCTHRRHTYTPCTGTPCTGTCSTRPPHEAKEQQEQGQEQEEEGKEQGPEDVAMAILTSPV